MTQRRANRSLKPRPWAHSTARLHGPDSALRAVIGGLAQIGGVAWFALCSGWLLGACDTKPTAQTELHPTATDPHPAEGHPSPAATAPQALAEPSAADPASLQDRAQGRAFGAPMRSGVREVGLTELLADPAAYKGAAVQTHGQVARVCQARGCWMELQAAQGSQTLRVPMAGHAFFLPRDSVGATATVQGDVRVQALTKAQAAHYAAEGMQSTEQAVSLHAKSVLLDTP